MKELFLNYSLDCELPVGTSYLGEERKSFFHGPQTWDEAERSVRGFVERMSDLGVVKGATLFVYPDVACEQKRVFRDLADAGVEIALHLNGLRYSKLRGKQAKWLGEMTRGEQKKALQMAKSDLEDALGGACLGYRACYGSANADTFPILEELGFIWSSNSSNRWRPEFFANWDGSWPFPHHASRHSQLIPGDLPLYEIPVSSCPELCFDGNVNQPFDFRLETPVSLNGENRGTFRQGIGILLEKMNRRDAPVRAFIGASHNTVPLWDPESYQAENLKWLVWHVTELAKENSLTPVPASFEAITRHAADSGAY